MTFILPKLFNDSISMILSLARRVDHMSSPISFPALTSVTVFVFFLMSAIIIPVSHQSPSSLQHHLLSFLPHRSVPAVPLVPNRHRKKLSQVIAGQQKVSSRDDRMLCSLPAPPASTHHIIQHRAKVQSADCPPHNQQFSNPVFILFLIL